MDMSRPLVRSQGNLDPIDGFVIFRELQAASGDPTVLKENIADCKRIIELKGAHFVSSDTLDLGMIMWTSHWLADEEAYFTDLAKQAERQVHTLLDEGYLDLPTRRRLAFREYGTCLGIGCLLQPDGQIQACRNAMIDTWGKYREGTP